MNKTFKNVLILFGFLCVLYAIYGLFKGADYAEASGGILIGVLIIIGVNSFSKKKKINNRDRLSTPDRFISNL